MEILEAMRKRASAREFSKKKPDWREIIEAINSTTLAPMAGGTFSMRFMLIDNKKLIDEIAKWSEQDFIKQSKYIVIAISNKKIVTIPFPKRGIIFSHQQAGASIQNFLLHLTSIGLSTCWVGHFNEEKVKMLLKIPEDHTIEALFPIGYSKGKLKKKKTKHDLYNFLYFNQWKNNRMRKVEKIDARFPEGY